MAKFEIVMPKLGESIVEATLTKWLKQVGEQISEDEAIAEIATDKVDSEVPSPVAGIIEQLLFKEGDVVEIGKPIAVIALDGKVPSDPKSGAQQPVSQKQPSEAPVQKSVEVPQEIILAEPLGQSDSGRFYSPLVRNIAKEEGIGMEELEKIAGSGKDNRLTKDDLMKYLSTRGQAAQRPAAVSHGAQAQSAAVKPVHLPEAKAEAGDEVIEMSRMRKLIVQHMVASEATSVHVTSVIEIDVTNLVRWREKNKKAFEMREGEKLTFTPVFVHAVARTLKEFPMLNSSVSGENIILRKNINIGMAAALPDGNLIVPVIRNADHKSLLGLVKDVNDLANRARNNKLQPDEIQGGTFTLTNVGSFDTIFATPIINQPQVAILATGAIKKRPVVLETEHGDTIAIRSMLYLSMSYDHRIVDGALGGMALRRMGEYLQNWDVNTPI